jgi:hypothetical protein
MIDSIKKFSFHGNPPAAGNSFLFRFLRLLLADALTPPSPSILLFLLFLLNSVCPRFRMSIIESQIGAMKAAGYQRKCRICHEHGHRADNRAFHPQEAGPLQSKRNRSEGFSESHLSDVELVKNVLIRPLQIESQRWDYGLVVAGAAQPGSERVAYVSFAAAAAAIAAPAGIASAIAAAATAAAAVAISAAPLHPHALISAPAITPDPTSAPAEPPTACQNDDALAGCRHLGSRSEQCQ